MDAEGWYVDPFGQHEARWFSNGVPTEVVRDGTVEDRDAPPSLTVPVDLVAVDDQHEFYDDLARADEPSEHHNVTDGSGRFGIGFG